MGLKVRWILNCHA